MAISRGGSLHLLNSFVVGLPERLRLILKEADLLLAIAHLLIERAHLALSFIPLTLSLLDTRLKLPAFVGSGVEPLELLL